MKKFILKTTFLFLIFSFILPTLVIAWSENTNGAWKYAYAYQISIVKYDGTGTPETIGKPILVYHPNLMQDIHVTTTNPMPKSYDDLTQNAWGFSQMIDEKEDSHISGIYWVGEDPNDPAAVVEDADNIEQLKLLVDKGEKEFDTHELYELAKDMVEDKNLTDQATVCNKDRCWISWYGKQRFVNIDKTSEVIIPSSVYQRPTKDPASGGTGYIKYTYRFTTSQKRMTFRGSDVRTNQYYKTISDSKLTENNVNSGYLETLVKTYAGSVKKIKDNFGIDIDYKDIDKYYVSVEPVQRVLDGVKQEYGSYYIDNFEKIIKQEMYFTSSDWRAISRSCNSEYTQKINEYFYYISNKVDSELCTKKTEGAKSITDGQSYFWHSGNCYNWRERLCRGYQLTYFFPGEKLIKELYGRYADGYSHLETSRKLGSGAVYLNRAVDYCNEEKNRHCQLEEDNKTCKKDRNGNIIYEYYVGPDRDKGITGTQNGSYYKLNGACYSGTGTTGIKNYFLPTLLDCPEVCAPSGNKDSDGFLACAENYCDAEVDFNRKGSPQKAKEACILTCGYKGTETNCETSSPYKNVSEVMGNGTTTCNVNNDGTGTKKGIIKTCSGDRINSFDGDDTNDTPFDIRSYITVACLETSEFKYQDTREISLKSGTGLDYHVDLNGNKTCQAYFNEDQWKFDYATISRKDPDRRKRLNYIKEVFNNMLSPNYDKTKSTYYDPDFAEQGDGEIDWNSYLYDTSKVSVKSQVTETIFGEKKKSALEALEKTQEIGKATNSIIQNQVVKKITNNRITNEPINRYEQISTTKATYQFNKRCVSTDGNATVKITTSDICYQAKDENGIVTPTKPQNVYYTNLKALGKNKIDTYANIGKEKKDENYYYDVSEACTFNVTQDPTTPNIDIIEDLSCDIKIEPVGTTQAWGNGIYYGGDVLVTIIPYDGLGANDGISGYTLKVRGTTYDGKSRQIGISDKKLALETIDIEGTVISSKGKTVTCPKTIYMNNPDSNCGVKCNLRKINDRLYELQSTGPQTPRAYYRALSIDMTQRKVYKSIVDQKYYIGLDQSITVPIEGNLILFGIVEGTMLTNGQVCKNTCNTPPPTLKSCYALYKPAETLAIRDYCNENWEEDVNDYENAAQCIRMCSNRCDEEIKRDLDKVVAYCRTNYTSLGFGNERICINTCYNENPSDDELTGLNGKTFIYRPINNSNPFPNSYDTEEPYEKGKRTVGANWTGLTDYIKHDDEDVTSVTGVYANQHVEYIIDLSASDIKKIQEDTEKNQRDKSNPYVEYEYKKSNDNSKYVKKYESKFIHEDFENLFRKDLT